MRTPRPRGGVPALGPPIAPLGLAIARRRPGPCASVETAPCTQLRRSASGDPAPGLEEAPRDAGRPRKPSRRGRRRDPPRTQPRIIAGGASPAFAGPQPPNHPSWVPPVPPLQSILGSSATACLGSRGLRAEVSAGGAVLGRGGRQGGRESGSGRAPHRRRVPRAGGPPDRAPSEQRGGGRGALAGSLLDTRPAPRVELVLCPPRRR